MASLRITRPSPHGLRTWINTISLLWILFSAMALRPMVCDANDLGVATNTLPQGRFFFDTQSSPPRYSTDPKPSYSELDDFWRSLTNKSNARWSKYNYQYIAKWTGILKTFPDLPQKLSVLENNKANYVKPTSAVVLHTDNSAVTIEASSIEVIFCDLDRPSIRHLRSELEAIIRESKNIGVWDAITVQDAKGQPTTIVLTANGCMDIKGRAGNISQFIHAEIASFRSEAHVTVQTFGGESGERAAISLLNWFKKATPTTGPPPHRVIALGQLSSLSIAGPWGSTIQETNIEIVNELSNKAVPLETYAQLGERMYTTRQSTEAAIAALITKHGLLSSSRTIPRAPVITPTPKPKPNFFRFFRR